MRLILISEGPGRQSPPPSRRQKFEEKINITPQIRGCSTLESFFITRSLVMIFYIFANILKCLLRVVESSSNGPHDGVAVHFGGGWHLVCVRMRRPGIKWHVDSSPGRMWSEPSHRSEWQGHFRANMMHSEHIYTWETHFICVTIAVRRTVLKTNTTS